MLLLLLLLLLRRRRGGADTTTTATTAAAAAASVVHLSLQSRDLGRSHRLLILIIRLRLLLWRLLADGSRGRCGGGGGGGVGKAGGAVIDDGAAVRGESDDGLGDAAGARLTTGSQHVSANNVRVENEISHRRRRSYPTRRRRRRRRR